MSIRAQRVPFRRPRRSMNNVALVIFVLFVLLAVARLVTTPRVECQGGQWSFSNNGSGFESRVVCLDPPGAYAP